MTSPSPTDIAVIGAEGRFPGARSASQYWANLCSGKESVTFLTTEQLNAAGVPQEILADPAYVRAAYLLEDADRFDAKFFGYAPREARCIDPQQRVLLECAWHALESAGYLGGAGQQTGVYVGSSLNTYLLYSGVAEQFKTDPVLTLMSNDKDFLATRIGYKLQLQGPCVTVQTACSTSLVAVHMACQAILAGECDMALAGGVCVKVPLNSGYFYREGGMLSRDGHCRAFDAGATGTIFGSGAGVVVLKLLADALRDDDTVLAVVKGSAINNDGGRKASYTAPSVCGLAEVIEQSLDFSRVRPESVTYVECHGTGTALGDPIEVQALTKAFGAPGSKRFCGLGSVKTNIGHLEAASGIASFIKTVYCLKNRYLPASLHFQTPNPAMQLDTSPFFVNAEAREWRAGDGPLTAAVNSLGVGGTNANVILQEAPVPERLPTRRHWHLLPVSAKSAHAAEALRTSLVAEARAPGGFSPADAAFTLHVGRREFEWRDVAFVDVPGADVWHAASAPVRAQSRPVVFLFGSDFHCSLIETLQVTEPDFSRTLDEVLGQVPSEVDCGCSPSAVAAQVALVRLWRSWGVEAVDQCADGAGQHTVRYLSEGSITSDAPGCVCTPEELDAQCRRLLDTHAKALFLPVGSATRLSAAVERLIGESNSQALVPPMRYFPVPGQLPSPLLQQAAALWKLGGAVDLGSLYAGERRRRVPLPTTPFHGQRHWY